MIVKLEDLRAVLTAGQDFIDSKGLYDYDCAQPFMRANKCAASITTKADVEKLYWAVWYLMDNAVRTIDWSDDKLYDLACACGDLKQRFELNLPLSMPIPLDVYTYWTDE